MDRILVLPKNLSVPHAFEDRFEKWLDIDVTSHSKNYGKQLSPFLLGECPLPDGRVARNMENAWQYSKVYAQHVNGKSNITKSWWEWSSRGFESGRADRYPMGKGAVPLFSYCNGQRLSYIEARKQLYIPMYVKLAVKTKAYAILLSFLRDNPDYGLVIRDFDAYDHHKLKRSWDDVVNDPHKKMGHGFALAMALDMGENFYRIWEKQNG